MKVIQIILLCIFILCTHRIIAQDRLEISIEQAEAQFLEKNLQLLAERYSIDIADAAIMQAKVLNNPTVGVSDVNFWYPKAADELGISPNTVGNKIVFSAQLEQMIRTAGKRRKLIDVEKTSKEIAVHQFESFLLGLKTELRITLHEVIYLQSYLDVIYFQQKAISNLVEVYKKQTSAGNIAKSELIRLQSSLVELETEANELLIELHGLYKSLKIFLNVPPETDILVVDAETATKNPNEILLNQLFDMAKNSHPVFLLSDLNIKYQENLLRYEKAQRSPDVGVSLNYDRYGGVWKNFIGMGVSIDIPMFNRNQGNIKIAELSIEQSNYNTEHQKNIVLQDIAEAYEHYTLNYNYYHKLMDNDFSEDLENMFDGYSRNFLNKNINMLEYIDFMYAYKTTKQAILTAKKNVETSFAELQFSVNNKIKE
jgi:cobalt-zinc-cadmium efflux system outer membrane protein